MRTQPLLRPFAALLAASLAAAGCGNRDHFVAPVVTSVTLAGASSSATAVNLIWTLPEGVDGSGGTRVYRDGHAVGISQDAGWTDFGLRPLTDYSYRVYAMDARGAEHSPSNVVVIRTTAAIVPKVYTSPAATSLAKGDSIQFTASVRDSATGVWLTGYSIAWSTGNALVAVVGPSGVVRATGGGVVEIKASAGQLSGVGMVQVTSAPPPDTVAATLTLVPGALSMEPGGHVQLQAVVRTASGVILTGRTLSWASSSETSAIVSSTGRVFAVAAGGAVITATSGALTGTASVVVNQPPPTGLAPVAAIEVTPASALLDIGTTAQFTATLRDAGNVVLTGRAVTWTSANASVAQISSAGLVTAVSAGTTTISATSEGVSGNASVTITIPAPPAVASIAINPPEASMSPGGTAQFVAITRDAQGNILANRPVVWSTVGTGTASISATGLVTAIAPGFVQITASSEGRMAAATITVVSAPTVSVASLTVTPPTAGITVGETVLLVATPRDGTGNVLVGRAIVWSSSNVGAATVSAGGMVTAVAQGTATITATSEGIGGTALITITVAPTDPVATLSVSPPTSQVEVGANVQLTATPRNAQGAVLTGRVIVWTSSNQSVATVSASGQVTGVAPGTTSILATSEGVQASASVTVVPKPVVTVVITPPNPSLCVAGSLQLVVIPRDADGNVLTGRVVVWSVSNGVVASVSSTGLMLGLSLGTVTVTATVEGVSAQVTISLCAPLVATVTVTSSSSVLGLLGLGLQLGAVARDAAGNIIVGRPVTWSVTPPQRALVSIGGLVTPLLLGDITVTATINGVQGTRVLSILPGF